MSWDRAVRSVNAANLRAFSERVYLRGECHQAIVHDDSYNSTGLEVTVQGRVTAIDVDTALVDRLKLIKDEEIEVRGQIYRVGSYAADSNGMTHIELR